MQKFHICPMKVSQQKFCRNFHETLIGFRLLQFIHQGSSEVTAEASSGLSEHSLRRSKISTVSKKYNFLFKSFQPPRRLPLVISIISHPALALKGCRKLVLTAKPPCKTFKLGAEFCECFMKFSWGSVSETLSSHL